MAKFVPDIKTQRWVIISPQRIGRPGAEELGKEVARQTCPFCPGNERLTPPEVFRLGRGNADGSGWQIRVVPNKYPITDIHEVIIHSPDNQKDIEDLPLPKVLDILRVYHQRFCLHQKIGQVIIFCNHGEQAGASLSHPHSQLVVIPKQINLDALSREPICNLLTKSEHFLLYCPDFSQWPYEVWIAPQNGEGRFGDIKEEEIGELSRLLQEILKKLATKFPNLQYNYYIYPGEDWYLRIIPRLVDRAGFELGTGLAVNIKDPAEAAEELRK